MELFNNMKGAIFSSDRAHRYALWRRWDDDKPAIMFIGLNPSTANEGKDDNTIRRVIGMAKAWGYGAVYMLNLFTYVSTDPKALIVVQEFTEADIHLKMIGEECETVVFAWGNFETFGRDEQVKKMFPGAKALHINKNGSPKHPLYCRKDSTLIPYINP